MIHSLGTQSGVRIASSVIKCPKQTDTDLHRQFKINCHVERFPGPRPRELLHVCVPGVSGDKIIMRPARRSRSSARDEAIHDLGHHALVARITDDSREASKFRNEVRAEIHTRYLSTIHIVCRVGRVQRVELTDHGGKSALLHDIGIVPLKCSDTCRHPWQTLPGCCLVLRFATWGWNLLVSGLRITWRVPHATTFRTLQRNSLSSPHSIERFEKSIWGDGRPSASVRSCAGRKPAAGGK